ncbi:MAG TPA: GtrA family protein [Propionibacterium sp.]|nr:GtrA family protein [Propionibacterium sp.]
MAGVTIPPEATGQDPRLPLGAQLFRFVVTGGVSAVVDFGLLVAGMALGLGPTPAKAISWVFGTVTAYAINSRWTFQSGGSRGRFAAVATLYVLTFALQVGTFAALFPPLQAAWGTTLAQVVGFVVAQGLATLVNFVVQRVWIFR